MASPLRMAKSSGAAPLHRRSHSVSYRSLPLFSILNPVRRKGVARARLRAPTNKSKDMALLVDVEELFVVYRISLLERSSLCFIASHLLARRSFFLPTCLHVNKLR